MISITRIKRANTAAVAEALARECLSLVIVAASLLRPFRISSCKSTLRIPAKSRDDGWRGVISALFLSNLSLLPLFAWLFPRSIVYCAFSVSLFIEAPFPRDLQRNNVRNIVCSTQTSAVNFVLRKRTKKMLDIKVLTI